MQHASCSNMERIKKQQGHKTEEQRQKGRKLNKTQRGNYRDWETDRKSTRLNSSHSAKSRMPSSA